ncbi:MAG: MarR family winged helix-turn-helix transcriptional regulator [Pseudomonadales bacterium]
MAKSSEANLVIDLVHLQSKLQKRVGGALNFHSLGLTEYLVLDRLYSAPQQKLRRSDLAEQVWLTPSGVTRLLNPMEKIGLIKKEENPRDARVSLVALTAAGQRTYEEAKVTFEDSAASFFKPLDKRNLKLLSELLGELNL